MSAEIVRAASAVPALRQQVQPLEFSPEQRKMILQSFLSGASESEAGVLLELARVRRLNPITKQIHFVKRWDSQKRAEVWSAQVGIDGFRAIAERTGLYDGQDEPEFEYDGKTLKLCKVRIYRKDWSRAAVGVAHFNEYAQRNKEGALTKMWAEKPHVMLAKCAEALAFRKAFPDDTSGLYAPEEMGAEPIERDATPLPPAPDFKPLIQNLDTERPAQPNHQALKAKIASRMTVIDVPAEPRKQEPLPDDFGTGKPLNEITDLQLQNQKAFLMKSTGKRAQSKLEAVLAEEERRSQAREPGSDDDVPKAGPNPDDVPF